MRQHTTGQNAGQNTAGIPQGRTQVRHTGGKSAGLSTNSISQDRTQVRQNSTEQSNSEAIPDTIERC